MRNHATPLPPPPSSRLRVGLCVVDIERRVPTETLVALAGRGHRVRVATDYGIATAGVAVGVDLQSGTLRGGADIRGERQVFGW